MVTEGGLWPTASKELRPSPTAHEEPNPVNSLEVNHPALELSDEPAAPAGT